MSRSTTSVKLSDDEARAFKRRASELGMTLGAYLRLLGRLDCGMDDGPTRTVRVRVPRGT